MQRELLVRWGVKLVGSAYVLSYARKGTLNDFKICYIPNTYMSYDLHL
jgi:hypothetical protein